MGKLLLPMQTIEHSIAIFHDDLLTQVRYDVFSILEDKPKRFNDKCVEMWKPHRTALIQYGLLACAEWADRGYTDHMFRKILKYRMGELFGGWPEFVGDPVMALAHKSYLVRQWPDIYTKVFPSVPDDIPMVWMTDSPSYKANYKQIAYSMGVAADGPA